MPPLPIPSHPPHRESEDNDRFSTSALCHELLHPIALRIAPTAIYRSCNSLIGFGSTGRRGRSIVQGQGTDEEAARTIERCASMCGIDQRIKCCGRRTRLV